MANSNAGSQGLLYAQIPPYYLSAPLNYHCLCPLLSPTSACPRDKSTHAFDWAKLGRKFSQIYSLVCLIVSCI